MQWRDKLPLGVSGICKQELALPLRYQAELGNEGDINTQFYDPPHLPRLFPVRSSFFSQNVSSRLIRPGKIMSIVITAVRVIIITTVSRAIMLKNGPFM